MKRGPISKPSLGPRDFHNAFMRLLSMGLKVEGKAENLGGGRHKVRVVDRKSGDPRGERITWHNGKIWVVEKVGGDKDAA